MILRDLSIGYTGSAPIVSSIGAELSCGQFICLLGRNGSGKSTLLRTMAGLLTPLEGKIDTRPCPPQSTQGGMTNACPNSSSLSNSSNRSNSSNPSNPSIFSSPSLVTPHCPDLQHTTVRELVAYGRLPYTGWFGRLSANDLQAAEEAIAKVGIQSLSQRFIHTLSDGERQKALIARALAQDTKYLLLDEPSAFLDYPSRRQLMQLLVQLAHKEGKAILLSTHDVELAATYADRLWVIREQYLIEKAPQAFSPEEL